MKYIYTSTLYYHLDLNTIRLATIPGLPTPPLLEWGEYELFPVSHMVLYSHSLSLVFGHRRHRGWDYDPKVGLIMAGSGSPKTNHSEISECGGTDFSELPSYDDVLQGHQGTCVTIIDEETVFVAGGMQGKSQNFFYLL